MWRIQLSIAGKWETELWSGRPGDKTKSFSSKGDLWLWLTSVVEEDATVDRVRISNRMLNFEGDPKNWLKQNVAAREKPKRSTS